jgi:hypothetical protein
VIVTIWDVVANRVDGFWSRQLLVGMSVRYVSWLGDD